MRDEGEKRREESTALIQIQVYKGEYFGTEVGECQSLHSDLGSDTRSAIKQVLKMDDNEMTEKYIQRELGILMCVLCLLHVLCG